MDERSEGLFSYVSCEARVPANHPLRAIRAIVDEALEVMSPAFEGLYSKIGRPSIPPEKLLRALLLQAFYSVRSERQLMEQLDYNLLFRWFVGLSMDAPVWDVTVFTKNRERLLAGDVAAKFLATVLGHVARNTSNRRSAIDGRTTRHPGYAVSLRVRKRIEEVFGWIKGAGLRKARHRGAARVGWMFTLTAAAYNLIRLPKLLAAA
nr:transposase [Azospirillum brasilense]